MKFATDIGKKTNLTEVIQPMLMHKGVTTFSIIVFMTLLIALVAFGALPRMLRNEKLAERAKEQITELPSVSVAIAQASDAIQKFTLPGSTQAIQDAPIYARVSGYMSKRYVDIGSKVHAGQMLAEIDVPEIDQQVAAAQSAVVEAVARLDNARQALRQAQANSLTAKANVQKAQTDLQFYTAQVERYTWLAKTGAVSLEDRDSYVRQYNSAVATLEALKETEHSALAGVDLAKASVHVSEAGLNVAKAQLDQLEATRSFKNVVAPFDGIVVKQNVDAGTLITLGSSNSNAVLFELAKTDILRVYVYVPEQYIPCIHANDKVLLRVQAYPNAQFVGTVVNVAGGLDTNSKTLQVEIHVKNDDHRLLPGMYAQVSFQVPAMTRLPIVPATVLQVRPEGSFLYVVDDQNRVHMKKAMIARDLGAQLELYDGVAIGDKVIMNPPSRIRDGILVKPVLAPAMKATQG